MDPPFTQANPTYSDEGDGNDSLIVPGPTSGMRRPSDAWLRNPAWIDGGVNPPCYYHSHEEIEATCFAYGVEPPPRYGDPEKVASVQGLTQSFPDGLGSAPAIPLATQYDILSSRVSPTPVPSQHYRDTAGGNGATPAEVLVNPAVSKEHGHLVNVTHIFTPSEPAPGPANRNSKALPKKKKTTMLGHITLQDITRTEFIKAFLTVHALDKHFAPGIHSGPEFKLSWTGSAGGKGGAPTILNDPSFNIALATILRKDKGKLQVTVEFDSDLMSGFRIQQPAVLKESTTDVGAGEELMYGNRIPQVSNFDDALQVNGRFVLELKKKWPCATHQGEHGESGHCYVSPNGDHIRLNPLRLKMWAAAMASGDVTKHEPPNVEAFDGPRDGRTVSVRFRPRATPAAPTPSVPVNTIPTNNDLMAVVMASLIPLIGGLTNKRSCPESPPPYASTSRLPSTPQQMTRHHPSTPKRSRYSMRRAILDSSELSQDVFSSPSSSPAVLVPAPGFELRVCLRDFAELEGIDMTEFEVPLQQEEYTPDIIPFVEDSVLRSILTNAPGGRIMKLKLFCKDWQINYERKIKSGSYTLTYPE